jgi:hypothetical protein
MKTIIYKEHLTPILTYLYKSKRTNLTKEDKSNIQEVNVKFFRRILRGKQGAAKLVMEFLGKELEFRMC